MIPWNQDYSQFNLDYYHLHQVVKPIEEALWEREQFGKTEAAVTTDPEKPVEGGDFPKWIKKAYQRIEEIAKYSVRRYNDDGSDYDPADSNYISGVLDHYTITGFTSWRVYDINYEKLTFPYPNGWKRRFPREIYKLSYPGTEGQRARFVVLHNAAFDPKLWWMAKTTDPDYGVLGITPLLEEVHAGQMFDNIGGIWTLSTNQNSGPDIIEEQITGVASHTWIPKEGDYLDWNNLNDLRDAINQCSIRLICSEFSMASVLPSGAAGGASSGGGSSWDDVSSKLAVNYTDLVTARADYDSSSVETFFQDNTTGIGGDPLAFFFGLYPEYIGHSESAKPKPTFESLTPKSYTVKVRTFHKAQFVGNANTVFTSYGANVRDAEGTDLATTLTNDAWLEIGTEIEQENTDLGPTIGLLLTTNPAYWPDSPTAGTMQAAGWYTDSTAMVMDLRVEGGFKWHEFTGDEVE